MLTRDLKLCAGCALDPLNVVRSQVLEPRVTVLGDNEREQIGDGVVVIRVGQDKL